MYYESHNPNTPIISIKEYIENSGIRSYNSFNEIKIDKIEDFNNNTLLNDIIKMSDDRICIASTSLNKEKLYLVILNLLDDDKMLINYYSFDMLDLNHKIYLDIKLYLYNNYICFGFSHCSNSNCGDTDNHYSSLIIFNYPNGTDINLNLIEFLNLNNGDIKKLNINFSDIINIDNNIFGYTISGIKIIDFSEKINLYYKKNNTIILKNYIVDTYDEINIFLPENNYEKGNYTIEYSSIIKEPNINNYIGNANNYSYINIDEYEINNYKSENEYIGRSLYYNIILNEILVSEGCFIEFCSLCNVDLECLECNNGYYYISDEFKCIPKPEENSSDENIVSTIINSTNPIIITTIPNFISTTFINEIISNTIKNEIISTTVKNELISTSIKNEIGTNDLESNILISTIVNQIIESSIINTINIPLTDNILIEGVCSYDEIYKNLCNKKLTNEQIKTIYFKLREKIIKREFNITNNNILYYTQNVIFHIATIKEQFISKYFNVSSIDFGLCENIIKEKYKIKKEDQIFIFKIDLKSNNSLAIYVQYELFNPYTLEYIPLDICKDIIININIPVFLNEDTESLYKSLNNSGYNLFDSNDSFYNDICATYTTENGTDITLLDRKMIIYDKNKDIYLCQEGCKFDIYNEFTKRSKCNCHIQNELINADINNINFDKKIFFEYFLMSSLKYSNFKVVKCYKLIFSLKGQLNNIGSYILILIIIILLVCMICYFIIGNKKIKQYIQIVHEQTFPNNNKKINTKIEIKNKQNKIYYEKFKTDVKEKNKYNKKIKEKKKRIIDKFKTNIKEKINKVDKKNKKKNNYPPKKKRINIDRSNHLKNIYTSIDIFKNDSSLKKIIDIKNYPLNKKK